MGEFHQASLFSFRRPQCVSFRVESTPRTWSRFNARMTPVRPNIVGPSRSATSNNTCIAACHSSASCSALQLHDVKRGVAKCDQLVPAGQLDRIEEPLIPQHGPPQKQGPGSLRGPRPRGVHPPATVYGLHIGIAGAAVKRRTMSEIHPLTGHAADKPNSTQMTES